MNVTVAATDEHIIMLFDAKLIPNINSGLIHFIYPPKS